MNNRTGVIEKIIEFSARNRFLIFVMSIVATIGGWSALQSIPVDAIPDLSETQVIIYSRWDRSPDIIEDQVTYPIISAMLGAPKVKDIRGFSDFGFSYVYVIFEDGTDPYWARSRTLEYLSKITPQLPDGVRTELGPDATGVGWIFQYALIDKSGRHSLADLRSYQSITKEEFSTMKNLTLTGLLLPVMIATSIYAQQTTKTTDKSEITPQQRQQMADLHRQMATCLESTKPLTDCRKEMMTSCQKMSGGCPMMKMHHGEMAGEGHEYYEEEHEEEYEEE